MVDTGTGFAGVKRSHGLWTNKVLLGGSAYDQTGGAVAEIAVSGTNVTAWVNGTISGVNAGFTGSITARTILNDTGSPWSNGITYQFTSRSSITGGMWVSLSGPGLAMGSPAIVAAPPIGVALATVASNATVSVLTQGIYPFIAEGTIEAGDVVKQGVGVAMNTVMTAGSPSYGAVGQAITRGGSEATILVYVGKGASF